MDRSGWAVVDGVGAALAAAHIPVDDPGLTLGWSVFETLRARGGQVLHLDDHLDRLRQSCQLGHIPMPDPSVLRTELAQAVAHTAPHCALRITLTGGGRRVVTAKPLDANRMGAPVRAVTAPYRPLGNLPGTLKHGSRMAWVLQLRASGADEVIFVDPANRFVEGTHTAVVAVVQGALRAPAQSDPRVLASVTLRQVLGCAKTLGISVVPEPAGPDMALQGVYVLSTLRGIAPVTHLNGQPLAGWDPIGQRLAKCLGQSL